MFSLVYAQPAVPMTQSQAYETSKIMFENSSMEVPF